LTLNVSAVRANRLEHEVKDNLHFVFDLDGAPCDADRPDTKIFLADAGFSTDVIDGSFPSE